MRLGEALRSVVLLAVAVYLPAQQLRNDGTFSLLSIPEVKIHQVLVHAAHDPVPRPWNKQGHGMPEHPRRPTGACSARPTPPRRAEPPGGGRRLRAGPPTCPLPSDETRAAAGRDPRNHVDLGNALGDVEPLRHGNLRHLALTDRTGRPLPFVTATTETRDGAGRDGPHGHTRQNDPRVRHESPPPRPGSRDRRTDTEPRMRHESPPRRRRKPWRAARTHGRTGQDDRRMRQGEHESPSPGGESGGRSRADARENPRVSYLTRGLPSGDQSAISSGSERRSRRPSPGSSRTTRP